ncbi:GlyGly-CTERM sorting domain-containing protein [Shewanella benthica]|nr:GlyGly-CTERM sorting domain-containing protein [Shewanella benthica]
MKRFNVSLIVSAVSLVLAQSAFATSFTEDAAPSVVQMYLNSTSNGKINRAYSTPRSLNATADSSEPLITCLDFPWGAFENAINDGCSPVDINNKTIDVLYFYHPTWADVMPSLGEAYKFARDSVELANMTFGATSETKVRLVGFEQPTFDGYRAKYHTIFGDLITDGWIDDIPVDLDFTYFSPSHLDANGDIVRGLDDFLQGSIYLAGHQDAIDADAVPANGALLQRLGADYYAWGRLREVEFNDGAESSLCGAGGGELSILMLDENSVIDGSCPNTFTHELGHTLQADHEEGKTQSSYTRARAMKCDGNFGVMGSIASSSNNKHFSSPDISVNGEVCGTEDSANNAWYVDKSTPYVASASPEMNIVGMVGFANLDVTASESDNSVSFYVMRDGDLTVETSVKVFIDGAVTGGLLEQDFIHVDFASGESEKLVSVTIIDNTTTTDNAQLTAELVLPVELSLSGNKSKMDIIITNDDQEVVTPPAPKPETGDSGGGAFGWLSIFGLGLIAIRRKIK